MSDSDDDLLALADVGASDSEEEIITTKQEELVIPYPFEGKYKDAEDRAKLDAMPEVEREEILYDRAQEMQRFEERRYLSQRRNQMARIADESDAPAPKRQRSTTGISSGTQSSLEALKKRREAQTRRSSKKSVEDSSDEEESEVEEESEEYSEEEYEQQWGRKRGKRVDWNSEEEDEESKELAKKLAEPLELSEINRIRWGKTLFLKYCQHPGFGDTVAGCFVRVNVGTNRQNESVYRLCQVKRVVPHAPYRVQGAHGAERMVDEALVASMAGSERTLQFGSCSDQPVTDREYEFWKSAMTDKGLGLPTRRRAQHIYEQQQALSKRSLTSEEIDVLVKRRAKLSGARGANAVLQKAELLHQREIAIDEGDTALVNEINKKLRFGGDEQEEAPKRDGRNVLAKVNERNRKMNVENVRKAEVQANVERRKAGNNSSGDPFSRLRTTARVFYKSGEEVVADQSGAQAAAQVAADVEKALENIDTSVPLSSIDDLIAGIDIPITISI